MVQSVIRVLWPQPPQKPVGDWLCGVEAVGLPAGAEQPVVTTEPVSLQWAVAACADADREQGIRFTVVLPAEMVLFDCVQLPAKSQRQALQALPFMVEEQLADDIEDVHLAIGDRQPGNGWPVIALTRQHMQSLFDLLQAMSAVPEQVAVDAEMLVLMPAQLRIVLHGERILVRSDKLAAGMTLDSAPLLMSLLEGNEAFKQVQLHYDEANEQHGLLARQWEAEFSALDEVQVRLSPLPASLSELLVPALRQTQPINLLQGDFLLRRKAGAGQAWWQWAAAACFALVVMQSGLQWVSGWYFTRQAADFVGVAEQQYRELFPDAKKVNNPRKRLESRLANDSSSVGQGGFASLFGATVKALQEVQGSGGKITVEQLRYEGKRGELELELTLQSIQQLDQLKGALGKVGLRADIASANEGDGGVTGHIKIGVGS